VLMSLPPTRPHPLPNGRLGASLHVVTNARVEAATTTWCVDVDILLMMMVSLLRILLVIVIL
jgi:hypothetical protein